MNKRVYLDNNATTPLHPEVQKIMTDNIDIFGNASSFHESGRRARSLIEKSRETISSYLGCSPLEIIFTAGGSESNNTALNTINCCNAACAAECKRRVITTSIEHPSVLNACMYFKKIGREVSFLPVDEYGIVRTADLEKEISPGLVSIMYANNEVGSIQPIKKLAEIAHKHKAVFHTDAVQAVGKLPFKIVDIDADMLSLSGHKLHGPKGIGVLYIKKGIHFCPLIIGGHHERNRRAGTENNLAIIGLGKAFEMLEKEFEEENEKLLRLKNKLRDGILESIPEVKLNGHETECLPGTLNISFKYIEGESILLMLDMEGIEVSTGSACASGSLDPSHVLLAMGLDPHFAHGSIRFSLGRDNTEADIDYVLLKLPAIVSKLRKMSPLYKGPVSARAVETGKSR
ncbi:MAG: cysteine desulfurase NifS [Candidatus Margulisiibacteriota bacterium]|nr:MAG: cysteine desulfurase NifS [Candidatus Margulisbacteria bacterium GWD2_39_127]OGI03228.1 MAG: cysteine desulfurase NifS [Candidatus Margulisbacteria bacterium GWF2_38_17]OGI11251.1 MAG: cysteine desulfurase NifS [Candidatus Margulisbacteria bacterium GWE2_39_32]PZM78530.1 MAG: cysteine desulfurase NifS [Candidatus Margulisiibacteriota bacterium]HAR63904.1 cysteine desulfurase NifS [Candidatus Margulisiibacteriota bacterium]